MRSHITTPVDAYSMNMRVIIAEMVPHAADMVVLTAARDATSEELITVSADPGLKPYCNDTRPKRQQQQERLETWCRNGWQNSTGDVASVPTPPVALQCTGYLGNVSSPQCEKAQHGSHARRVPQHY